VSDLTPEGLEKQLNALGEAGWHAVTGWFVAKSFQSVDLSRYAVLLERTGGEPERL